MRSLSVQNRFSIYVLRQTHKHTVTFEITGKTKFSKNARKYPRACYISRIYTRCALQWVSGDGVSFLTIAPLILWWSTSLLSCRLRQTTLSSCANFSDLSSFSSSDLHPARCGARAIILIEPARTAATLELLLEGGSEGYVAPGCDRCGGQLQKRRR